MKYFIVHLLFIYYILACGNAVEEDRAKKELEEYCSKKFEKVYFENMCYYLYSKGPCARGDWIVYNKENELICKNRPCKKGKLLFNGKCVRIREIMNKCDDDNIYVQNDGTVICKDCEENALYDIKTKTCVFKYTQSHCQKGQYIDQSSDGNVKCFENPCSSSEFIFSGNICYKKRFKSTCKNNLRFLNIPRNPKVICINQRKMRKYKTHSFLHTKSWNKNKVIHNVNRNQLLKIPMFRFNIQFMKHKRRNFERREERREVM